jgi:hypothetical protein
MELRFATHFTRSAKAPAGKRWASGVKGRAEGCGGRGKIGGYWRWLGMRERVVEGGRVYGGLALFAVF